VNAAEKLQKKMVGEKEGHLEQHLQKVTRVTEDIIDDETGRKIGEKVTSTINPLEPGDVKTPKEGSQIILFVN
jgi:hypothetical protein